MARDLPPNFLEVGLSCFVLMRALAGPDLVNLVVQIAPVQIARSTG
ncbi:MAG: hypothetical protein ACREAB_02850 [Blastocatellia bacterium]